MNIPCYNVSPWSPPWSLWKGNLDFKPPNRRTLHYYLHDQKVSVVLHSWEEAASAQVGRREVVCESGAPCCWSRPPADERERERERWRHSLITACWPRLLLQQRGGERGKSPSPCQRRQQQRQKGCLHLCTSCSVSFEPSLNRPHLVLRVTLVYVWPCSGMHIKMLSTPPTRTYTAKVLISLCGFCLTAMLNECGCLPMSFWPLSTLSVLNE